MPGLVQHIRHGRSSFWAVRAGILVPSAWSCGAWNGSEGADPVHSCPSVCVGIRGEDGKCVLARALRRFVEEGAADVRGQSSQLKAVSLVWHPVELEIRPPPPRFPFHCRPGYYQRRAMYPFLHWQVNYMPVSIIVVILEGQHLDLSRKIYSHLNFQTVHLKSFIYSLWAGVILNK